MKNPRSPTMRSVGKTARLILAVAAMALLLSWQFPVAVQAAAGDLDPAFGSGGKVTTLFPDCNKGYFYAEATAIAFQPDGKLLLAGIVGKWLLIGYGVMASDFAVARYNPDGTLDQTFGSGGLVNTDFGGSIPGVDGNDGREAASAIAVLSDGRIVAGGSSLSGFALACYLPDGTLDITFGREGKISGEAFGQIGGIRSLAIQADDRIIVAGGGLARFHSNGNLDETFGSGGVVLPDSANYFKDVDFQADGRIIAVGSSTSENRFSICRFTADGIPDPTFGSNGAVTTKFSYSGERASRASANSVTFTREGNIVAAGYAYFRTTSYHLVMACYTGDGSLAPAFGSGGKIINDLTNRSGKAIVVQSDGRLVVAATIPSGTATSDRDFLFFRFNPDGSLDSSLGSGGLISTDFGSGESVGDLAIAPNGRLVLAGVTGGWEGSFAVACYLTGLETETAPQITGVELNDLSLYVYGKNFENGANLFLNGEKQNKTFNDARTPATLLIAKKSGKWIAPGQTVLLQVKNTDGRLSNEFWFTRP